MKNFSFIVGIDVSKLKLDVTFLEEPLEKKPFHFVVENNQKGIAQIIKALKNKSLDLNQILFCFEDTGVYSMPLSCYFSENNLNYWMIPAIEIKRSKGISRGKNDKTDSKDIAFYAQTHQHKLRLSKMPEKDLLALKLLFTEREKLMKTLAIMSKTSENEGFVPKEALCEVLKINKQMIKQIKAAIKKTEDKMQEIIAKNEELKTQNELIQTIPGVGPQTALYLILITKSFHSFENWRQLACYAGVAPFEYSSGTSIKGRTKVSHLADKKLKSLLNLCALNMKKYDPEIKTYFDKKVEEGKPKMLVINNIRAKIISRVFATIKRGTPYVNTYKFAS
jgi:transposase